MVSVIGVLELTAVLFVILTILRWFIRRGYGSVDKSKEINIRGKTVLITGANTGIGKAAAFEFADRDAHVILACRDVRKANEATEWIRSKTSRGKIVCMQLDLSSLQSVREFSKLFNSKYDELDILVNNAGVAMPDDERKTTQDGFEILMGVNHLGHFLLTNLLLNPIKKAAPSRIVTVSSMAHTSGVIDFENLAKLNTNQKKVGAFTFQRYSNSKLANALFNKQLANKLQGTGVNCYALCPGFVMTDIGRDLKGPLFLIVKLLTPLLRYLAMKTPAEGAATIMYCALSKDLVNKSGDLYQHCGHWDQNSRPVLKDEEAERLWIESAKLVGLL